jgi:hypothetical protein
MLQEKASGQIAITGRERKKETGYLQYQRPLRDGRMDLQWLRTAHLLFRKRDW